MFEPEVFAAILNGTYSLEDPLKATKDKLAAANSQTERLVKQVPPSRVAQPNWWVRAMTPSTLG